MHGMDEMDKEAKMAVLDEIKSLMETMMGKKLSKNAKVKIEVEDMEPSAMIGSESEVEIESPHMEPEHESVESKAEEALEHKMGIEANEEDEIEERLKKKFGK